MNLKKKVINKGYTLEITSWENDADHYKTINKTVETLEEAKMLHQICTTLFNAHRGIGNSMDKEELDRVVEYYNDNKQLFKDISDFQIFEKDYPIIDEHDEDCIEAFWDLFTAWAGELIGYSDVYDFRVCESVVVTYSPEDIYLEEIKF